MSQTFISFATKVLSDLQQDLLASHHTRDAIVGKFNLAMGGLSNNIESSD